MDGSGGGAASARNWYKFERAMLPLMTSDLHPGIHTSSCGHVMHASCWKTYFEDVQQSERNRSRLRSPQNFNALKQVNTYYNSPLNNMLHCENFLFQKQPFKK